MGASIIFDENEARAYAVLYDVFKRAAITNGEKAAIDGCFMGSRSGYKGRTSVITKAAMMAFLSNSGRI
jgi:hypothetical protein